MGQRIDPSGRIRVILLGDVIEPFENYNSFTVIDFAPAIETTLIPSVQENMVSVAPRSCKRGGQAGRVFAAHEIKENYSDRLTLWGSVSTLRGTLDRRCIREHVADRLETATPGGGFILAPGQRTVPRHAQGELPILHRGSKLAQEIRRSRPKALITG